MGIETLTSNNHEFKNTLSNTLIMAKYLNIEAKLSRYCHIILCDWGLYLSEGKI